MPLHGAIMLNTKNPSIVQATYTLDQLCFALTTVTRLPLTSLFTYFCDSHQITDDIPITIHYLLNNLYSINHVVTKLYKSNVIALWPIHYFKYVDKPYIPVYFAIHPSAPSTLHLHLFIHIIVFLIFSAGCQPAQGIAGRRPGQTMRSPSQTPLNLYRCNAVNYTRLLVWLK